MVRLRVWSSPAAWLGGVRSVEAKRTIMEGPDIALFQAVAPLGAGGSRVECKISRVCLQVRSDSSSWSKCLEEDAGQCISLILLIH